MWRVIHSDILNRATNTARNSSVLIPSTSSSGSRSAMFGSSFCFTPFNCCVTFNMYNNAWKKNSYLYLK